MKKFITSMFALATLLTASAQMASNVQARVYAYNLQQEVDTESKDVTSYKITFQTNCAANEGEAFVLLMQDGEEVYRIPAEATDNTLKNWEAVVDVYTVQEIAGNVEAGDYNWSVEVAAGPVNAFTELHDPNSKDFFIYRSYALSVDKSPESKFFGRAYVVNQYPWSGTITASRTKVLSCGMYTYAADLTPENNGNPYTACDMIGRNEAANNNSATASNPIGCSPSDMCITEDGRLFMSNGSSTYAGIYYIDPETFSNSLVFQNISRTTNTVSNALTTIEDKTTGDHITGVMYYNGLKRATVPVAARGAGENTQLIQHDPSLFTTNGYSCDFNTFNIGNSNTWQGAPSYTVQPMTFNGSTSSKVYAYRRSSAMDATKNGFWVAQMTDSGSKNTANAPSLFYYSEIAGTVVYCTYEYQSNATSTALAVNEDLGLVAYTAAAVSSQTPAVVLKYTEDATTGAITVDNINGTDYILKDLGSKADAMDFDYAGNLYAVTSGNEKFRVYALPDAIVGENKRVTPAKSDLLVKLTAEDITTGIVEVGVDAGAAVEYYNLQGVKVENPSNGIFIKKQGNKTTKVVL